MTRPHLVYTQFFNKTCIYPKMIYHTETKHGSLRPDFLKINSLKFSFKRETDTEKKVEKFCKASILEKENGPKHQVCQIAKCQMFLCITVNCIIHELKFFKIAQFFFGRTSFSRERKFEKIEIGNSFFRKSKSR